MMDLRVVLGMAALVALGACGRGAPGANPLPENPEALPTTGGYVGYFNNPDQSHADLCVELRDSVAELRYADGSPSGFALRDEILVPQPGNGVWCPREGMARLDAREFVPTADGRRMLFHRGGWGFKGNDPGSAVHYGHVLVEDLDSMGLRYERSDTIARLPGQPRGRWVPAPLLPWPGPGQLAGNGSACRSLAQKPLRVAVHSIPGDMKYLNTARTNAIPYAIYGSPAEDLGPEEDRARGIRYTLLQWSWINVRGGGVARALVPDGESFYRCQMVPPIRLAAVADVETMRKTGWVEAVYGAIPAGDGGLLHGWIVSAHRHGQEPIVKHLVD